MVTQKQAEEAIVANYGEMEVEGKEPERTDEASLKRNVKSFFWHGGSVYDAWFSCASNQMVPLSSLLVEKTESLDTGWIATARMFR